MSLLRLLTAGRSLVGMNQSGSRYRVADRRLLPKFGPAQTHFRSAEAEAVCAQRDALVQAETRPALALPQTAPAQTLGGVHSSELPQSTEMVHANANPLAQTSLSAEAPIAGSAAVLPTQPQQPSSHPEESAGLLTRWTRAMRSRLWGKRPQGAKSAIPNFSKTAVQCELSLDGVKVVRNDLSDADLEVVLAKKPAAVVRVAETSKRRSLPRPEQVETPVLRKSAQVELAGVVQGRLGLRQFGAGKL